MTCSNFGPMALRLAQRGEAPKANPPCLVRLLLGLAWAGPSSYPGGQATTPFQLPSRGPQRKRNRERE